MYPVLALPTILAHSNRTEYLPAVARRRNSNASLKHLHAPLQPINPPHNPGLEIESKALNSWPVFQATCRRASIGLDQTTASCQHEPMLLCARLLAWLLPPTESASGALLSFSCCDVWHKRGHTLRPELLMKQAALGAAKLTRFYFGIRAAENGPVQTIGLGGCPKRQVWRMP